jgi:hypothetical protein
VVEETPDPYALPKFHDTGLDSSTDANGYGLMVRRAQISRPGLKNILITQMFFAVGIQ